MPKCRSFPTSLHLQPLVKSLLFAVKCKQYHLFFLSSCSFGALSLLELTAILYSLAGQHLLAHTQLQSMLQVSGVCVCVCVCVSVYSSLYKSPSGRMLHSE